MHLASVSVRGFRCLKSVDVDLSDGLNVLVGRNNTGKTALLDAVRLALGPSAARSDAVWLTEDDFTCERGKPRGLKIEVNLRFEGLSEKQRARFFEITEFNVDEPEKSVASIRLEASWPQRKKHPTIRRYGGPPHPDHPQVPREILERLPVTFLPALRDAEAALTPGYRNRLALLFRDLANRQDMHPREAVEQIFRQANKDLTKQDFIRNVSSTLCDSTRNMAGSDYQPVSVAAAPPEFERILRTLCIKMDDSPLSSISSNGLGYNNLLYIATVLVHLSDSEDEECPILLIEEPEAHLHPQWTLLLGRFLSEKASGESGPQTIVTTHSPTLASSIPPGRIHVLFQKPGSDEIVCNGIRGTGLKPSEERALLRMMDVTRSTLYFCKGLILVEGISEALLVPVLAKLLGYDLGEKHIAVLPICGVAFGTFEKLFSDSGLGIPVAFITDGDPPMKRKGNDWRQDAPEREDGGFVIGDRVRKLLSRFEKHPTVHVEHSQVTLEYDLAAAGGGNPRLMTEVWETCFGGKPRTLNRELLAKAEKSLEDQAMTVWRGICRAGHSGSKADFAHRLAERLQCGEKGDNIDFEIPVYIERAVEHVVRAVGSATGAEDGDAD